MRPFLISVISAAVLAYLFYPLYLKLKTKVKKESLAALIICAIIIISVILPSILLVKTLATQAISTYALASQFLSKITSTTGVYGEIHTSMSEYVSPETMLLGVTSFFADASKSFLSTLPSKVLNFLVIIILLYYLLKEGEELPKQIEHVIPFKKNVKQKIIHETKEVTRAVIYGSLLTAAIQGALGAVGFAILGIPSPIFWGIIMALFSLLPILGTGIIWFPASMILLIQGILTNEGVMIFKGVFLLAYGVLIIGLIDNFVRPKIIGDKAKIHPVIILLGIVGGIPLLGFIGIILGPLVLAVFITLLRIYGDEYGV